MPNSSEQAAERLSRAEYFAWAAIALLVLLFGNANLPVTDPVESNYALTAKEMWQAGNWFAPQIYGKYWYDKPIFTYWLLEAAYSLFGPTAFASRLAVALPGVATVVGTVAFTARLWGRTAGRYAGGMLLTTLAFWVISRGIVTDSSLLWWTAVTFAGAYVGLLRDSRRGMIVAYAGAGFACLTKGPVGLVLPGLILLAWLAVTPEVRRFRRLFDPVGIAVFAVVGLSWYGLMYQAHGKEFLDGFIGLHNITRATVSEHPEDNHWYYYLLIMPLSALPWTPTALAEMWRVWRDRRSGEKVSAATRLCLVWLGVTFLFYTAMATKYVTYTYITVLPFVLLAAGYWARETARSKRYLLVAVPALLLAVLYYALNWRFAAESVWISAVLAVVSCFVLWRGMRGTPQGLWVRAVLVLVTAATVLVGQGLVRLTTERSILPAAETWRTLPGAAYTYSNYAASYPFYTGIVPYRVHKEDKAGAWAGKYTMPQVNEEEFANRLATGEPLSLWVPRSGKEAFAREAYAGQLVPVAAYPQGVLYRTPER